ncbi:MAG TPA: hypothetical protein VGJ75_26430 [Dongiaceae bacterium]|jgi:hypothetical protein
MTQVAPFIAALEVAAKEATAAETAYRRAAAERIKALERDRAFAFRRLSLMKPIADAIVGAESEEMAVAGSQVILRAKLGWANDSEARSAILTQFVPVVRGLFAGTHPKPGETAPDVLVLLSAFEAWYESAHRGSFWDLFDQPMPETPLVDF